MSVEIGSQAVPEGAEQKPPPPDVFGRAREQESRTRRVEDVDLARDMAEAEAPGREKSREIEKAGSDIVRNRQRVLDEYSSRFWPDMLLGKRSDIEFPADNPPLRDHSAIYARVYCDLARHHAEEIIRDEALPSDQKYRLLDSIQPDMSGALRGNPSPTDLEFYDSVAKATGGRLEPHHVPCLLGRIAGFVTRAGVTNEQILNTMIDALGSRYSQDRTEGRMRVLDMLAPEIFIMRQAEGSFADKHGLYDKLMAESGRTWNPRSKRYELRLEI